MSRMMCALKYGCFTDYFLDEETVIHILGAVFLVKMEGIQRTLIM